MNDSTLGVGTTISHYRILSRLGAGGMGEVYLAEDISLRRRVALKLLSLDLTRNEGRLSRFEQEAQAASALNHPNIITIHEIGSVDRTHFIATEFIDGVTLRQRMIEGRMSLTEVLEVAMQTASALAAAHEAGVVHRDIKPENVMLRTDGFVKVLDFGLAKLTEKEKMPGADPEAPTLTKADTAFGIVMGTVSYMSPEQASGLKDIGEFTDIWSLGVVIYEMVAHRLPFGFEGATPTQIISLIIQKEAPPLKQFASEIPDELNRIVMKALENTRADRYQSAGEMLVDLRRLNKQVQREAEQERSIPAESVSGSAVDSAQSETTIIVADDHPIFRQGLKQLIERELGFRVIAEAEDGATALGLIKTHLPMVAVLDLDMPETDGFSVAGQVQKLNLPVKVIILTMHKDELHVNRAIDLSVSGYVLKDGAVHEIINCIKTVKTGRQYFTPALSSLLLNRSRRPAQAREQFGLAELTPTERRILFLLSELKTSREIADELCISPRTVDNHRAHICSKLNLQGSHALVKFALQYKAELK
jgi:serine/threonine protein kinase/DNA-binding CsgD family transcriptional regulator